MRVTKVYNERTGDPMVDNRARHLNRALHRTCDGHVKITARSRRRRAQLMRIEFPRYVECVAFVADELHRKRGGERA